MQYCFKDFSTDIKTIQKQSNLNQYFLENCSKQIESVNEFFTNNSKLLVVNGYLGTGKTALIDHCLNFLNPDCIVLKYNCFETTILDDILLKFFEEFKNYTAMGKIKPIRTKFENFTQRINSYFEHIEKPILIIINSFEEILKTNKNAIYVFLRHLCTKQNIKIILITRTFKNEDFDIPYKKVSVLALEKPLFEKFLRSEDFKQIGPLSDELYKHSRGYFFYTNLAIKLMKHKQMQLIDFLDAFSKSLVTFNDFILREALSLVDPVSGHLFRFLAIVRHPISIKLLKTLQLYNEEKANFFIDNLLLSRDGESLYLQDYYKIIAENSISENVATKIHQGCVDLYNTQLPIKPLERDLLLSRQTMRNEIEYHSMFIPQKPILVAQDISPEASYTNYSEQAKELPEEPIVDIKAEKNEKIKKMSFIFDEGDLGILNTIADSIKNYVTFTDKRKQEEKEDSKLSFKELLSRAQNEENVFNYKHAVALYQKALLKKNEEDYYTYLPTIYTKLAQNYQNLSNWYDAQKYYEMAKDFYNSVGDIENANEMKYNIANVYYMIFKKDKAKNLLLEIEKENVSAELKIKAYNMLATLSNDANISEKYYEKALEYSEENVNKLVLAELYYKYANVLEDLDDDESAIKYYKKCIGSETDSEYMSGALSNIAVMYDEMGDSELAVKYYKESFKIDKQNQNLSGIYSTAMKLAEIYSAKNPAKALEYYKRALNSANELNETFYIISASTALGDFYFNRRNDKSAYKYFKIAYDLVINSNYKENIDKIEARINDIKIRVGEEEFKKIAR